MNIKISGVTFNYPEESDIIFNSLEELKDAKCLYEIVKNNNKLDSDILKKIVDLVISINDPLWVYQLVLIVSDNNRKKLIQCLILNDEYKYLALYTNSIAINKKFINKMIMELSHLGTVEYFNLLDISKSEQVDIIFNAPDSSDKFDVIKKYISNSIENYEAVRDYLFNNFDETKIMEYYDVKNCIPKFLVTEVIIAHNDGNVMYNFFIKLWRTDPVYALTILPRITSVLVNKTDYENIIKLLVFLENNEVNIQDDAKQLIANDLRGKQQGALFIILVTAGINILFNYVIYKLHRQLLTDNDCANLSVLFANSNNAKYIYLFLNTLPNVNQELLVDALVNTNDFAFFNKIINKSVFIDKFEKEIYPMFINKLAKHIKQLDVNKYIKNEDYQLSMSLVKVLTSPIK